MSDKVPVHVLDDEFVLITHKQLQGVIDQVNSKIIELQDRIEALEKNQPQAGE